MAGTNVTEDSFKLETTKKSANLKQHPQSNEINEDEARVVVKGDLHGNFLMLIHWLLEQNVIELKGGAKTYRELVNLYQNITQYNFENREENKKFYDFKNHEENKKFIENFNNVLSKITKTNNPILVKLIGDVLADRGPCDYFTLLLMDRLEELAVPFDVMLSNHDVWCIDYLIQFMNGARVSTAKEDWSIYTHNQGISLANLINLLKTASNTTTDNLRTQNEVMAYGRNYLNHLKLIDYIRENNRLVFLTHAPNHPMIVKKTVDALNNIINNLNLDNNKIEKITYEDDNLDNFCKTIDAINRTVQNNFKILQEICIQIIEANDGNPFERLTWLKTKQWAQNDDYTTQITYQTRVENFLKSKQKKWLDETQIVHGHDNRNIAQFKNSREEQKKTISIDGDLGKATPGGVTKYDGNYQECTVPIVMETYRKNAYEYSIFYRLFELQETKTIFKACEEILKDPSIDNKLQQVGKKTTEFLETLKNNNFALLVNRFWLILADLQTITNSPTSKDKFRERFQHIYAGLSTFPTEYQELFKETYTEYLNNPRADGKFKDSIKELTTIKSVKKLVHDCVTYGFRFLSLEQIALVVKYFDQFTTDNQKKIRGKAEEFLNEVQNQKESEKIAALNKLNVKPNEIELLLSLLNHGLYDGGLQAKAKINNVDLGLTEAATKLLTLPLSEDQTKKFTERKNEYNGNQFKSHIIKNAYKNAYMVLKVLSTIDLLTKDRKTAFEATINKFSDAEKNELKISWESYKNKNGFLNNSENPLLTYFKKLVSSPNDPYNDINSWLNATTIRRLEPWEKDMLLNTILPQLPRASRESLSNDLYYSGEVNGKAPITPRQELRNTLEQTLRELQNNDLKTILNKLIDAFDGITPQAGNGLGWNTADITTDKDQESYLNLLDNSTPDQETQGLIRKLIEEVIGEKAVAKSFTPFYNVLVYKKNAADAKERKRMLEEIGKTTTSASLRLPEEPPANQVLQTGLIQPSAPPADLVFSDYSNRQVLPTTYSNNQRSPTNKDISTLINAIEEYKKKKSDVGFSFDTNTGPIADRLLLDTDFSNLSAGDIKLLNQLNSELKSIEDNCAHFYTNLVKSLIGKINNPQKSQKQQ